MPVDNAMDELQHARYFNLTASSVLRRAAEFAARLLEQPPGYFTLDTLESFKTAKTLVGRGNMQYTPAPKNHPSHKRERREERDMPVAEYSNTPAEDHKCRHTSAVNTQHALEVIIFNIRGAHEKRVGRFLVQGAQVEQLRDGFFAALCEVLVVAF
ncbi:hypothetical protein OPT61_g8156 [Boeremia exigua]|uniref:Uncharacterized protein n=1 Tax=Boeremia exigua TaxID=749465 RepID=A0ACC2HZM1_9PLEO|nr:hypothetical protein OPT61_g8156 [Boeremia exigua]